MNTPVLTDVKSASTIISPFIHRTPILTSRSLNQREGSNVHFKCENFQKTGAFKARGACNAVLNLPDSVKTVVTHSSGNHGAALSWAASLKNKSAFVICPTNASVSKRENIKRYGGKLVNCGESLSDREEALRRFLSTQDATFIPPYDDRRIIAGQGTCAYELISIKYPTWTRYGHP